MSEKTITQLALDAGVETGGTENALAILKFAKAYADQEKRSTAIAFAEWVEGRYEKQRFIANDNRWEPTGNRVFATALLKTTAELYDLYINSTK